MAQENTHWEPLGPGCKVLVSPAHHFTTDTLLLAYFSMPRGKERCADVGTGCGTIPLLWRMRGRRGPITGLELQPAAAVQARLSVEESGFTKEITILQGDARQMSSYFSNQALDLMACNPPYKAPGAGLQNPHPEKRLARHEEALTLEELAQGARYALRFGGRLCICLRPERLAQAMGVFSAHRLEPKRLRLVQQRVTSAPSLFLLECRSGGKPGLVVQPTLLLEEAGKYSKEMEKIYGCYRQAAGSEMGTGEETWN